MYMPIDIMIADTTRSMIMKGMKIMKPMRNADSISESTKAGITVVSGSVSGCLASSWRERGEEAELLVLRLLQHPLLEGHLAGVDGLGGRQLPVLVGLYRHVVRSSRAPEP